MSMGMVAVYLSAYVIILRQATGREAILLFVVSLAVGFGALIGALVPRWEAGRNAGQVRVRLRGTPARGSWLLAICSIPLLVALVAKSIELRPSTHPILSAALVAAIMSSACLAVVAVRQRSLRLCEHGIVINGRVFSPWHRIGSGGWTFDETGRLVIGRGPWQVIAQVPAYKRERVEDLLKTKTAEPK